MAGSGASKVLFLFGVRDGDTKPNDRSITGEIEKRLGLIKNEEIPGVLDRDVLSADIVMIYQLINGSTSSLIAYDPNSINIEYSQYGSINDIKISNTAFHLTWKLSEPVNLRKFPNLSPINSIPLYTWKKCLSDKPKGVQEFSVSITEGMRNIKLGYRLWRHTRKEKSQGRTSAIDPFRGANGGATMGVPLGGIGSGCIGRGWRGDYARWQLRPGYPKYRMVDGNQFSFRCARSDEPDKPTVCSVMYPYNGDGKSKSKLQSAWNWDLGENLNQSYYHALFPRSWTVYNCFQPDIRLQCTQISPVIAHNYKESCFPVSVFSWEIDNNSDHRQDVSLMFTWENTMGIRLSHGHGSGHKNQKFSLEKENKKISGIQLIHKQTKVCEYKKKKLKHTATYMDPLSYAIAAVDDGEGKITFRTSTKVTSESDAAELWSQFQSSGKLNDEDEQYETVKGERTCAALCYSNSLAPHSRVTVEFSIAWDMPIIRFGSSRAYYRRYTKFYGIGEEIVQHIAADALLHWKNWNQQIEIWQEPILSNPELPEYYKFGLFNELYYLVAGGSEWIHKPVVSDEQNLTSIDIVDSSENPVDDKCEEGEEIAEVYDADNDRDDEHLFTYSFDNEFGKFLYLESLEYLMYNTYDVHWYASFALAMCWPQIELNIQRDIAVGTLEDYSENWKILSSGSKGMRKVRGAVPHDVGHPGGDPWHCVNSYNIQDVSRWKDLNSKFVLQTFRDYLLTEDLSFLQELWPVVKEAVEYLSVFTNCKDEISSPEEIENFKLNGEDSPFVNCMVENQGFPDQTYDAWSVNGTSAYCGGLWVACLTAAAKMAEILGYKEEASKYSLLCKNARIYYDKMLWNGEYFNYDSSRGSVSDSIMSDQLAGNWYSNSCYLTSVVDDDKAILALKKIYEFNLLQFKAAKLGVVNGMRPSGKVDSSCLQSVEVWTGTCYTLAAHMWQMGMKEECMKVVKSTLEANYDLGYAFQTPEAWDKQGRYRAIGYMRPLSIWSIQWAIEQESQTKIENKKSSAELIKKRSKSKKRKKSRKVKNKK